jgi:hypothetical protein
MPRAYKSVDEPRSIINSFGWTESHLLSNPISRSTVNYSPESIVSERGRHTFS